MKLVIYSFLTGFVLSWYFAASVRNKVIDIEPIEQSEPLYAEKPTVKLWHGTDSVAMEFIYLANTYLCFNREKEALVLFKHVCTLNHELPGVFLSTGMLYYFSGDFENAQTYFKLEIEHSQRFVQTHYLKRQFVMALYESYLLLGDSKSASAINKKYHLTNNGEF